VAVDWKEKLKKFQDMQRAGGQKVSPQGPKSLSPVPSGASEKGNAKSVGTEAQQMKKQQTPNTTKGGANRPNSKDKRRGGRQLWPQHQSSPSRRPDAAADKSALQAQLNSTQSAYGPSSPEPARQPTADERKAKHYDSLLDEAMRWPRQSGLVATADHASTRSASYLESGWHTSVPGAAGRKRQLAIGIDFGTAWTKVCVARARESWVVPWFPMQRTSARYLLPGILHVAKDGSSDLGELTTPRSQFSDLKLPILNNAATPIDEARVVTFLALVMRYTRHWMLSENRDLLQGDKIEWVVNVGFPAATWNESAQLARFRILARLAWRLSCDPDAVNCVRAKMELENSDIKALGDALLNIQVAPEFAGQIAGYVKSAQRRPDLHLMVDIGAGTVDITTFNIHRDFDTLENIYPIFEPEIVNLGTHFLTNNRIFKTPFQDVQHPTERVLPTLAFAETYGLDAGDLQARDAALERRVAKSIAQVLSKTKNRWYPSSPHWSDGVPAFLCGGGAAVANYQSAFLNCGKKVRKVQMVMPSRMVAPHLSEDDFTRVSPAYGLAQSFEDLGRCRPSTEVGEMRSSDKQTNRESTYISKDDV